MGIKKPNRARYSVTNGKPEVKSVSMISFLNPERYRYRYCRMLEEGSFRGRTADFVFMFLFGGLLMTVSLNVKQPPRRRGRVSIVSFL